MSRSLSSLLHVLAGTTLLLMVTSMIDGELVGHCVYCQRQDETRNQVKVTTASMFWGLTS